MTQNYRIGARWLFSIAALILTLGRSLALDQVVTHSGDNGGTDQLRARLNAVQSSGGGTLTFDVGTTTIVLNSVLPGITSNVVIEGADEVTLSGADASRIFSINSGATLSLRNLILTNGYSSGANGGAIHNSGTLNVSSCKFFENETGLDFGGGAIASEGLLNISRSEFGSNAAGKGGALYLPLGGTVTSIEHSHFHDNMALHATNSSSPDGWGGAILSGLEVQVTIDASTFTQNSAHVGGGFASVGPSILNNCSFSGNVATPDARFSSGRGGGIHVSAFALTMNGGTMSNNSARVGGGITNAAYLTVNRVTFIHNTATETGGGISSTAPTELNGVTFQENTARFGGGAACTSATFSPPSPGGPITIQNTTFSGNSAESGGGLFVNFGPSSLTNTTFSGNTASSHGGAIYNSSPQGPNLFLKNTLIANSSTGGNCYDASLDPAFLASNGFNLSDDGTCEPYLNQPSDTNGVPALLGPLDSNGGPTQTHLPLAGSPAIDGGTSEGAPARDQRGYLRAGAAPDIGAAEFGGTIPVTLANISTRSKIETGDQVSIGGFIVTGTHEKVLVVRGIGPSLPLASALLDPTLELRDAGGQLVASNDNWQTNANAGDIQNAGLAPSDPAEAALLGAFSPGAYTAILRGANDTTGIGLVEVYALDRTTDSKLANISTRSSVQVGDNVLIGGFVVVGVDPQRVIVRAIGPSLQVTGSLGDPTVELHDSNGGVIANNDNWRSTQEAEIIATTIPPGNDLESAIIATLNPGPYTAIVSGVNGTTGVALVEVYALATP